MKSKAHDALLSLRRKHNGFTILKLRRKPAILKLRKKPAILKLRRKPAILKLKRVVHHLETEESSPSS